MFSYTPVCVCKSVDERYSHVSFHTHSCSLYTNDNLCPQRNTSSAVYPHIQPEIKEPTLTHLSRMDSPNLISKRSQFPNLGVFGGIFHFHPTLIDH